MNKNQIGFVLTVLLMAVSAACAQNAREAAKTSTSTAATSTASTSSCTPLETRTANVPEQKPAFSGQTRACEVKSNVAIDVTVLAKGLNRPWAVEPLSNGDFLITEKMGNLRIVSAKGEVGQPIGGLLPVGAGGLSSASGQGGLPPITARGQGGLLDVALSRILTETAPFFGAFRNSAKAGAEQASRAEF